MSDLIELDTDRLRLSAWRDEHLAPFAALNADPEVMRHFPSTLTAAESDAMVERMRAHHRRHGYTFWAVERKDTGEFVGFVGLLVPRHALPCQPCVEVGWRLARRHWGQGFASEGARAALQFAFDGLGLDEVVAFTVPANAASRAVMARVGMQDTGRDFDHPAVPEGPLKRHCLYAIQRHAWKVHASTTSAALVADPPLPALLRALEVELHHPGVRSRRERLDVLLHPGFHEVGRSGLAYDRATVIDHLVRAETHPDTQSDAFRLETLGPDRALLTYRSADRLPAGGLGRHTLRSSLWERADGRWRLRYHQGTPAAVTW